MSSTCAGPSSYSVSTLAKNMHDFPHRDRNFETVSSLFDPSKTEYLEGAAFSAAVFLLVGIILFVFTVAYLVCCCVCCKPNADSEKRPGCHWLFLVVSCVIIGVGLILGYYGNEDTKKGIVNAADAIIEGNQTVASATGKLSGITGELDTSNTALIRLKAVWQASSVTPTEKAGLARTTDEAINFVQEARSQTVDIERQLDDIVDVAKYADDMKDYDSYRWKGTIGALCFIILLILLVVVAILFNLTWLLKLIVGLSMFALLVMWLATGVFASVAVLGGDFCVDPNGYVDRETANKSYGDIVRYYVYCGNCLNPLEDEYNTTRRRIDDVQIIMVGLTDYAERRNIPAATVQLSIINGSVSSAEENLISVYDNEVRCPTIHGTYNSLLSAACKKTLDGAIYTFAGALMIGVMLCVLIMSAQGYWRRLEMEDSGWGQAPSQRSRRRFKRESYKMRRHY